VREPAALTHHRFIRVDVPDEVSRISVDEAALPADWSRRITVTRAWGDRWLREGDTALLVVRSVLVPETYNVLINPRHADSARIRRLAVMPYSPDSRRVPRE
jgi:RES domain-containing protein